MDSASGDDKNLKAIFEKVLPTELSDVMEDCIYFDGDGFSFNYPNDDNSPEDMYSKLFEEKFCEILDNLKTQIDIIHTIPEEAIVLPEDVIVYRGVNSLRERSEKIPAKSLLMSTSAKPETAKLYGGENCYIYKIKLGKGTPVLITPYKVRKRYDGGYIVMMPNLSDRNEPKEIIINLDFMRNFEITEQMVSTPHYKFKDGEFIQTENGYIVTGEMKPIRDLISHIPII